MVLDGGRKPEYLERTHAYTGGTCKLHTERPQPVVEPGDGANHHTTVRPPPKPKMVKIKTSTAA